MIPNEYLFYYYHSRKAVQNILLSGITRGESIVSLNNNFFAQIREQFQHEDPKSMCKTYLKYIQKRSNSYMANETRLNEADLEVMSHSSEIGYAEIALDLIVSLSGGKQNSLILNVSNEGSITGMNFNDIVEIPVFVSRDSIQQTQVGEVPDYCLGLMKQIKAFEKLTIEAALEGSYTKAVMALTIHPLVGDFDIAKKILAGYINQHGTYFPPLS
jgi:6-phospho-beta-glucosidase